VSANQNATQKYRYTAKHSASHPKFASHALPTQLWGVQAEPGAANYKKRQNQNPYRTVPGHKRTWARRPSNKTWVTKYRKETYDHHCRADIHRGWAIPRLPGMSINHDHETQPPPRRVPKNPQTAVPPSEDKLQCECNKAEERVTMIWRCRVAGHLANVPVAWCRLAMLCYAMVFLTNRWYTTTLYCNTIYLNVLSLEINSRISWYCPQ
jgi:hypothetical protein